VIDDIHNQNDNDNHIHIDNHNHNDNGPGLIITINNSYSCNNCNTLNQLHVVVYIETHVIERKSV